MKKREYDIAVVGAGRRPGWTANLPGSLEICTHSAKLCDDSPALPFLTDGQPALYSAARSSAKTKCLRLVSIVRPGWSFHHLFAN